MAEGQTGATRPSWLWTELFRTFQVALDPKKLLLAALGLVLAGVINYLVSAAFFWMKSEPKAVNYDPATYVKKGMDEATAKIKAADAFQVDTINYEFAKSLAGDNGYFRTMPWHEHRGQNPYLMVTGNASSPWVLTQWVLGEGFTFLIEPLVKFMKPVTALLDSRADFSTRIYLLIIALCTLGVWAFFGGAITRIAVMQFAGKEAPGLTETLRFVCQKYTHYVAAPMVPVFFVAGIVVITMLFGLVHLVPFLGDLWDGLLWPIPMLLGFAQALLLVGLVGYPLMFATISAEGTDTFDALSRSYNYVYQSPWHYIWCSLVAIAYGMVVVFFVGFMGSFVVYLSKWAVAQTPGTEHFSSRRADHLFMYAPTTFGWRDLLVDRPELKTTASEEVRQAYMTSTLMAGNYFSAFCVGLWTTLVLLFVVGYGYSYFFSASTMIYMLMRAHVDDTEMDEVYAEEEVPDEPLLPPTTLPGPGTSPPPPAGPSLQMVDAPTLRTSSGDGQIAAPDKPATPS